MAETQIRFEDGLSYERYMGDWSRRVGTVFIEWLAPLSGLKWIDVGCGNGAFTELIVERCAPKEVRGIDPSEAQLDFARKRSATQLAKFDHGDAMALPFASAAFSAIARSSSPRTTLSWPAAGCASRISTFEPGTNPSS